MNACKSASKITTLDWLAGMGITGLAEEILFRGFLLGTLAVLVPERLRIGALDLPVAAYFGALIFVAMLWQTFLVSRLHLRDRAADLRLRLGSDLCLADGALGQPARTDDRALRG